MLCIKTRRKKRYYEKLPLLPKHVIRVRQYGNNVSLTIDGINRKFNKVSWKKDGEKISLNTKQVKIHHQTTSSSLVLYDVTRGDSGTYQCVMEAGRDVECSDLTLLEFMSITLHEYSRASNKTTTRKEMRTILEHQPIISPKGGNRNFVKYDVIITKTWGAAEERKEALLADTTETDIRRVLHYGVLLSDNSRLQWNTMTGPSVIDEIYQRFHNTSIRPKSPDECRTKCAKIPTLKCTDQYATFSSGDIEYAALCAFLKNGCVTNKLAALLDSKNVMVIKRYFRSNNYKPIYREKCICIPEMYFKKLRKN